MLFCILSLMMVLYVQNLCKILKLWYCGKLKQFLKIVCRWHGCWTYWRISFHIISMAMSESMEVAWATNARRASIDSTVNIYVVTFCLSFSENVVNNLHLLRVHCWISFCVLYWSLTYIELVTDSISPFIHFWHAPLGVCSTKRKH